MRITNIARRSRTRTALALLAGAALLGLSACSPDAGGGSDEPSAATTASSDDDDAQETESQVTEQETESQGMEQDDSADQPSDGGGATNTAADRTRLMLKIDLGLDDTGGEGAPVLASDELAALLAESFGGTADCDAELVLEPGAAAVDCLGPASIDRTEPTQAWVANVVMVPAESGFQNGSSVAVLFSTGAALPEEADDLLDEDVTLTGLGFGSVYGMDPLSADDLAASTLQTLTSDNAYVPVGQMADWEDVTCEDGLDFTRFETVDCEASTADGTSWDLVVAPGTYMDNDQGLLVGIDRTSNG